MKCSFQRIEGAGKTLSKLWNVAKFVSLFPKSHKPEKLQPLDEWIINEMNSLIDYSRKCYESYDFHNPAVRIRNFLWETFASHYLELVKNRAYNEHEKFAKSEQASALFALHYSLENMLKLLAPILPFVTAKLYRELAEKDIHGERFPQPLGVPVAHFAKEELMDMNSAIWKHKKDKGLSLKAEIEELTMDEKFRIIEKDIMLTHSVKKNKLWKSRD